MPNYCRNELQISDFTGDIPFSLMEEKLVEFVRETIPNYEKRIERALSQQENKITEEKLRWHPRSVFDFMNIIPYPEEFLQQDKDHHELTKEEFQAKYPDDPEGEGGYLWRIQNWGVKWNASDSLYVAQQKTFYFDTPWTHCIPVISKLHELFPTAWLHYEYYEQGMAFVGGCEFVPEKYWDPADYSASDVFRQERELKLFGNVKPMPWKAGTPYNPWIMEGYRGFKRRLNETLRT